MMPAGLAQVIVGVAFVIESELVVLAAAKIPSLV